MRSDRFILYLMIVTTCLLRGPFFSFAQAQTSSEPCIYLTIESWDLGEIEEGDVFEYSFKVKNTGNSDLIITDIRVSCECIHIFLDESNFKIIIPSNSELEIEIEFDSVGLKDKFAEYIYIHSNDPDQKITRVMLKGEISNRYSPEEFGLPEVEKHETTSFLNINKRGPIEISMFYSVGCRHCQKIKNEFLPKLKKKWGNLIEIRYFDISVMENYELLVNLEEEYGVKRGREPPEVFVGGYFLNGEREIREKLEEVVADCVLEKDQGVRYITPDMVRHYDQGSKVLKHFKSFSAWAVAGAGLIDGINPCAFTIIVFFISFLSFAGWRKKEVLWIGSSFILAVFLTYLLLGIGLFKFFQTIQIFSVLSRVVYLLTAFLALVLGVLSICDYYRYKTTRETKGLKLQLPSAIKKKMQSIIRRNMGIRKEASHYKAIFLLVPAFIAGFIVSLLESVCTGQVYLPTIAFVMGMPDLKINALVYLVVYNLMFIIPLGIVFIFAFIGTTSQQFERIARKHLGKVKLLTAGLFFGLAVMLIALNG